MQGFNYAADKKDWTATFDAAANLNGQVGKSTSARLYSMIETNSTDKMIGAIDAAVKNKKITLLLGLWASGEQKDFSIELGLLNDAIDKYKSSFTDLIYAVSVGSEDLHRTSIGNTKGKGNTVANVQHYICQTRQLLAAKGLSKIPDGHVDTWQMWLDGRAGQKILENIDWVGMNDYAYFEYVAQSESQKNFSGVYTEISKNVNELPVWVTEPAGPSTLPPMLPTRPSQVSKKPTTTGRQSAAAPCLVRSTPGGTYSPILPNMVLSPASVSHRPIPIHAACLTSRAPLILLPKRTGPPSPLWQGIASLIASYLVRRPLERCRVVQQGL